MTRGARYAAATLLFLALVPACAHMERSSSPPAVTYVDRDTAWSGVVSVEGIVHVRKGATLTLLPGTRVVFAARRFPSDEEHIGFSGPGMHVEGRMVAEGTEDARIVFTSAAAPVLPGSWDKILFSFSAGSRFAHCTFEGARFAFHAHFSDISIRSCLFRGNEEGVRLGVSRVTIEDSVFTGNEIRGINFRECRNVIRRNLVYGNGDGIFLHSKNSASVVRENSIYSNRNFNARLGDLHADDIDLSGNWWGTAREEDARATVFDGRNAPGVGAVRISPVLARPPVSGSEIRGIFAAENAPVKGAIVRAYGSISDGFLGGGFAAEGQTDENGSFHLKVPPGRYFVSGRAELPEGMLFAFPGNNPVSVSLGETREIGMPAVPLSPKAVTSKAHDSRESIVVRTTRLGRPEGMVAVQAFRPDAPDFRGHGEAFALTGEDGTARIFLPPGKYLLSARKRVDGASTGMVEDGGMFGAYPFSPVDLPAGSVVSVEIPLFLKRGLFLDGDKAAPAAQGEKQAGGLAILSGKPAQGYIVFFYSPPETVGRPVARSSVVSESGAFQVRLPADGDYEAYLRKAIRDVPGSAAEERTGPVNVRLKGDSLLPETLDFGRQGR